MEPQKKVLVRLGALGVVLLSGGALLIFWATIPFEQQVLAAQHLDLTGETFPPDGGSRMFFFQFAGGHHLILLVRQRDPRFDGNPDIQEIWLCKNPNFEKYISLQAGSRLENKVLELVRTASCKSNQAVEITQPPTPEMLPWIVKRISDRKSKWSKYDAP
jgi:hypothetical protein